MEQIKNITSVKRHLETHNSTKNLTWKENKQKASLAIYNYINKKLKPFSIDYKKDNLIEIKKKTAEIEKIKDTLKYVLDELQKSFNKGDENSLPKFDDLDKEVKAQLNEKIYNNLTDNSTDESKKLPKNLLKNLKIIVTHKNTDGICNNSNTKTKWFADSSSKYNIRTDTHEKIRQAITNPSYKGCKELPIIKGLIDKSGTYIGKTNYYYKPHWYSIFDKSYEDRNGFGILKLGSEYNYAIVKAKWKKGVAISGQIKSHDTNDGILKNNIEFIRNNNGSYTFIRKVIDLTNRITYNYSFTTKTFKENLKLITGLVEEFEKLNLDKENISTYYNKYKKLLTIKNDRLEYKGEVNSKNEFDGYGKIFWKDTNHIYEGYFKNGSPFGKGIIYKENGKFNIEYKENSISEEQITYINEIATLKAIPENINYISNKLSHSAKIYLQKLLKIENVENTNLPSTIVLGDADGSIGRIILAAIQSGHIEFKKNHILELLIEVLECENECAYYEELEKFQKDKLISQKLDIILSEIIYKEGNYKLICIGDILHDRFSNNKEATGILIEQLHSFGAIFIRGNHDVKKHCFHSNNTRAISTDQAGESAYVDIAEKRGLEIEKKFVNCYYDKNTNKFYIHNGIEYDATHKKYITAFGDLVDNFNENIEVLTKKINRMHTTSRKLTSFRPDDELMKDIPIFFNNNCIIVHGHSSTQYINEHVYNVNARKSSQFYPAAILF